MGDTIKTAAFKAVRTAADTYAKRNQLPQWSSRVAWFCLVYGPVATGQIVRRRDFDTSGKAIKAFSQLMLNGRISVVDDGVYYTEGEDEGRTLEWFDGLVRDATP
jgi:hypothetical protein